MSTKPWAQPVRSSSDLLIPNAACANYGYWTSSTTTACYDTHNASSPIFTDTSVNNNIDRQWQWFLCNEPFFYWQEYVKSKFPLALPIRPILLSQHFLLTSLMQSNQRRTLPHPQPRLPLHQPRLLDPPMPTILPHSKRVHLR